MIDEILVIANVSELFDIVIAREDVTHHKPDPEAYVLALERLQAEKTNTLIFEDSEAGVIAAWLAGCSVIAIQHEFNVSHNFSRARRVISSFEEMLRAETKPIHHTRSN